MDICFKTDIGRFNFRVAGMIIHKGRLLVMTDEYSPYYYLPGGRVNMHETGEEAIRREIKEELEIDAKVQQMIWIVENLFHEEHRNEEYHELGFYYLVELEKEEVYSRGNEFTMNEEGKLLTFKWVPLEEVKELFLYPLFLREKIMNLPQGIEHIIERK